MLMRAGKVLGTLAVTAVAILVMVGVSIAWNAKKQNQGQPKDAAKKAPRALTATRVAVKEIKRERIEIVKKFSGRLEPFETYTLAFEIGGRLRSLGETEDGKELDEGSRVKAGQVLAKLDDRILKASVADAKARLDDAKGKLELASQDYERGKQARKAITDEVFDGRVMRLKEANAHFKMAEAQLARVQTNLEDAVLVSPIDGVISKRYVHVGESINLHQKIFTIVQVNKVLLVVGVPESEVRNIKVGQKVDLDFLGRGIMGEAWPSKTGKVHLVSEVEDPLSRLFEAEILVDNSDGDLKPGLIALARIVTKVQDGYRIPESSVIFRVQPDPETGKKREVGSIYSVSRVADESEADTGDFKEGTESKSKTGMRAIRFTLDTWIEQDRHVIVTDLPSQHRMIVVRGQHRLVDNRPVEIISRKGDDGDLNDLDRSPGVHVSGSSRERAR